MIIFFDSKIYRYLTFTSIIYISAKIIIIAFSVDSKILELSGDYYNKLGRRQFYCLFNNLFGLTTKKTSRQRVHAPLWGELTHWGRDKMDAISQTTFSSAFSWIKIFEFRLKIHSSFFPGVQLTIFQHWLGAVQATSHYLNQWWVVYWRIYASLGLNELMYCREFPLQRATNAQMLPWHDVFMRNSNI